MRTLVIRLLFQVLINNPLLDYFLWRNSNEGTSCCSFSLDISIEGNFHGGAPFPRRYVVSRRPFPFSCFNHSTGLLIYQRAVLYSHPTMEGSPGIMKRSAAAHFVVIADLRGSSIIGAETLCLVHRRKSEASLEVAAAAGGTL